MNPLHYKPVSRHVLLSLVLAALLVTSGCSGILFESSNVSETTPSPTSAKEDTPANTTDLRRITIPSNGSTTVFSELDEGDPVVVDAPYEPVEITAEAGAVVNITMRADGAEPKIRLYSPNGTLVDITTARGSETAQLTAIGLNQTGRYTIEAAASRPDTTFEYTLTIERDDRLFSGPLSMWNETERYLEFGRDFADAANATADNGQFYWSRDVQNLSANAEEDYIIIGYSWDAQNLTGVEMNELDTALLLTYTNLAETYRNATDNPEYVEDESWIPDVIYFRAMSPEGNLYRANFLTKEWAQDYAETENGQVYAGRYYSTNRIGPGSPSYEPGARENIYTTQEEFPLGTYLNYTHGDGETHAEKYYSENSTGD